MLKRILNRYKELSRPIKASLWFVACGVMKDAIDVLVTPVFTRILTKEQYGYFNVYNSWFQIVKILFALFLFSEIFNVGLSRYEEDSDRFVSSTLGFVTFSTFLYLVVYFLFRTQINAFIGMPGFLVLLLFVHVIVYSAYYCWLRKERFDYRYEKAVIVSSLYIILQPLLAILAILYLKISLDPGYTRILAAVGVQIIIGVVLYVYMMAKGKTFYDRKYWRYSLKTGFELVPYSLSKVILNQSDRIMINRFSGSGDTAIYSVAHSAAFVLQVVTEAVNGSFMPWLYRKLKEKNYAGICRIVNSLVVLVAAAVILIDLAAPEIMLILAKNDYYIGVYCIPSLVFSVYLIFLYTLFSNVELFYGKNIGVTLISSIGTIINIVLNLLFIPKYGFIIAGYTTMASYLVICLGHYIVMMNCLQEKGVDATNLFDMRFVFWLSFALLGLSFMCILIYRWMWLRWGIILLFLIALFLTRKRWIALLTKLKENDE